MSYSDDDLLMISGLQHFCFCRRQWALIHIEQAWAENVKTTEGEVIHENCHNEDFAEKRGDLLIVRGLRVVSYSLGVTGQCDVVEFHLSDVGAELNGRKGLWQPFPVEYKRGRSKMGDEDRLQLCCQAMCLEEMLACTIPEGALFYNETHRREMVSFDDELRNKVRDMLQEMHGYYGRGYTPKVKPKSGCNSCSLKELCLPVLCKGKSAKHYYGEVLQGV